MVIYTSGRNERKGNFIGSGNTAFRGSKGTSVYNPKTGETTYGSSKGGSLGQSGSITKDKKGKVTKVVYSTGKKTITIEGNVGTAGLTQKEVNAQNAQKQEVKIGGVSFSAKASNLVRRRYNEQMQEQKSQPQTVEFSPKAYSLYQKRRTEIRDVYVGDIINTTNKLKSKGITKTPYNIGGGFDYKNYALNYFPKKVIESVVIAGIIVTLLPEEAGAIGVLSLGYVGYSGAKAIAERTFVPFVRENAPYFVGGLLMGGIGKGVKEVSLSDKNIKFGSPEIKWGKGELYQKEGIRSFGENIRSAEISGYFPIDRNIRTTPLERLTYSYKYNKAVITDKGTGEPMGTLLKVPAGGETLSTIGASNKAIVEIPVMKRNLFGKWKEAEIKEIKVKISTSGTALVSPTKEIIMNVQKGDVLVGKESYGIAIQQEFNLGAKKGVVITKMRGIKTPSREFEGYDKSFKIKLMGKSIAEASKISGFAQEIIYTGKEGRSLTAGSAYSLNGKGEAQAIIDYSGENFISGSRLNLKPVKSGGLAINFNIWKNEGFVRIGGRSYKVKLQKSNLLGNKEFSGYYATSYSKIYIKQGESFDTFIHEATHKNINFEIESQFGARYATIEKNAPAVKEAKRFLGRATVKDINKGYKNEPSLNEEFITFASEKYFHLKMDVKSGMSFEKKNAKMELKTSRKKFPNLFNFFEKNYGDITKFDAKFRLKKEKLSYTENIEHTPTKSTVKLYDTRTYGIKTLSDMYGKIKEFEIKNEASALKKSRSRFRDFSEQMKAKKSISQNLEQLKFEKPQQQITISGTQQATSPSIKRIASEQIRGETIKIKSKSIPYMQTSSTIQKYSTININPKKSVSGIKLKESNIFNVQQQKSVQRTTQTQKQFQVQKIIQFQQQKSVQRTTQTQKQFQVQKIIQFQQQPARGFAFENILTPSIPSFPFSSFERMGKRTKKKKKLRTKLKQPKKYTSTLFSRVLNIRGRNNAATTGLEIRPILIRG